MNRRGKIFFGVMVFLFVGMSFIGMFIQRGLENKIYSQIPEEVVGHGMKLLDDIKERNYEDAVNSFISQYRDDVNTERQLVGLSDLLNDSGDYIDKEIAGYHYNNTNGTIYHQLVYEIKYSQSYVVYTFVLVEEGGKLKTYGIHLNQSPTSLKEEVKFSFKDKGVMHYIVLAGMVISLLFSIFTASVCFSTDKKRRILWSLICLGGVGSLTFVWSTGSMNMGILTLGIPTGGFGKSGTFGSVIMYIRFPLGAMLYWLIKHRASRDAVKEDKCEENRIEDKRLEERGELEKTEQIVDGPKEI